MEKVDMLVFVLFSYFCFANFGIDIILTEHLVCSNNRIWGLTLIRSPTFPEKSYCQKHESLITTWPKCVETENSIVLHSMYVYLLCLRSSKGFYIQV